MRLAYELKLSGKHPDEIAELLEFPSGAAVNKAITDQLQRDAAMMSTENRDSMIALQNARLEFMLSRLWPAIEHGDPKSISEGAKLVAQITKLNQLDAIDVSAQTMQVLVVGGAEEDYVGKLKGLVHGDGA